MATTTSFDDFTGNLDQDDFHELWSLYEAARGEGETDPRDPSTWDGWHTVTVATNGARIIKRNSDGDRLVLASERARQAFLRHLEGFADDFDGDMESWYGFQQAMDNPKS